MSASEVDPAALAQQAGQQRVWNDAAQDWRETQKYLLPASQVVNGRLVSLAHIGTGQRVLDAATGIGEPALTVARVVGPSGSVVGVDHAPQMLTIARERATAAGLGNATFLDGNAQALDQLGLTAQSFDAVLSRWGLMFFEPLVPALEGFRRVLRPGGYLAAAVWGAPQQVPIISASCAAVMQQLGRPLPPPDAPGPFNLADPARLSQSLTDAGFRDVRTEQLTVSTTFPSVEAYVGDQRLVNMLVRTVIGQQPEDQQTALWQTVAQTGARMASPDGSVTLHNLCLCVVGQA